MKMEIEKLKKIYEILINRFFIFVLGISELQVFSGVCSVAEQLEQQILTTLYYDTNSKILASGFCSILISYEIVS